MKMMQGAFFLACSKRSRTRAAPTPTNISTKSEPLMEKKGTPASPATARASSVFPVPGGPTSRTPFGILAPSFRKRSGSFRNSTTSCSSNFASSHPPATSLKSTPVPSSETTRALLLPMLRALPAARPALRRTKIQIMIRIPMGRAQASRRVPIGWGRTPVNFTPAACSSLTRSGSSIRTVRNRKDSSLSSPASSSSAGSPPSFAFPGSILPRTSSTSTEHSTTSPCARCCLNSL